MTPLARTALGSLARRALLVATAWGVCACATPSGESASAPDPARGGFVVSERVRVDGDVREDFESAVRLLEQEQYASAIALLTQVTEAAPQLTAAWIDLGMAHARVGDVERARSCLERAVEQNPKHPVAYNELGMVLRRSGRFADARRSYEQALELQPDFHFARRNLAILCDLYLADAGCALEHYERYVQAAPGDEAAAKWVADLRARAGR
jgi:Flp pilus assembly protein TadD